MLIVHARYQNQGYTGIADWKAIKEIKPDCIIHLAALNEIDSAKDPDLADKVNCDGTKHLIAAANEYNVAKFIYFSTFHIYGKAIKNVVNENTVPEPFHPYATTHYRAEKALSRVPFEEIQTLVLRLSNSYGYPMDKTVNRWSLVVNDLCRQAVVEKKIKLKSSGNQCRDFIAIEDVARAIFHFLFVIPNGWGDGVYNLGSGESTTILDMAKRIANFHKKKYGTSVQIEIPEEKNVINEIKFSYSIDKLLSTGFSLKGDMEQEIVKTMDICEGFLA